MILKDKPIIHKAFEDYLLNHENVFILLRKQSDELYTILEKILICINSGGKLMLCGNGGSAADCQHLAAELTGRFKLDRRPLPALALSTDTSAITAISNDYHFDDIFARQVQALGKSNDCLIAISTSGNSNNVMRAVEVAREMQITTIGLLGKDGGKLKKLLDDSIVVKALSTARIQEAHIFLGHVLCELIEESLVDDDLDGVVI